MATLAAYDAQRRQEWRALLGLEGGLKARPSAGEWVRRRAGRILPCLAASGPDLADLADQLGLDPCPTTGTAEAQPQLAGAK
jgi:hypothetical protein